MSDKERKLLVNTYVSNLNPGEFEMIVKNYIDDLNYFISILKVINYLIDCFYHRVGKFESKLLNKKVDQTIINTRAFAVISAHYIYDVSSQFFQELEYYKNGQSLYKVKNTSLNKPFKVTMRTTEHHSDLFYECWPTSKQYHTTAFNKIKRSFREVTSKLNDLYKESITGLKDYLKHLNQFGFSYSLKIYLEYYCLYDDEINNYAINDFNNNLLIIEKTDFIKQFDLSNLEGDHKKLTLRDYKRTVNISMNKAVGMLYQDTNSNPYRNVDVTSNESTFKACMLYFQKLELRNNEVISSNSFDVSLEL
jgi:hypothetical protein